MKLSLIRAGMERGHDYDSRFDGVSRVCRVTRSGAPLDNNVCERALKRAILHRKNALFCRTLHGSQVGDLFMSLIHTCELAGANPFDYLAELQKHPTELVANPSAWMPWNYGEDLAQAGVR
jgi:hypothetical protein